MIDDTKVHILSHPMSPDVKRNITIENWLLITHNAFRALVAKGYATANREIVLPYAANMKLMVKKCHFALIFIKYYSMFLNYVNLLQTRPGMKNFRSGLSNMQTSA